MEWSIRWSAKNHEWRRSFDKLSWHNLIPTVRITLILMDEWICRTSHFLFSRFIKSEGYCNKSETIKPECSLWITSQPRSQGFFSLFTLKSAEDRYIYGWLPDLRLSAWSVHRSRFVQVCVFTTKHQNLRHIEVIDIFHLKKR